MRFKNMRHVRGAPFHPQTQGKIERQSQSGHQALKNRILLEKLLPSQRSGSARRALQPPALSREP